MSDEFETAARHDDIDGVPSPAATPKLIGHRSQWNELVGAEQSGRLHHAWLLQGPRGIGKATAAFAFARRLLGASGIASAPALFRQVAQGSHPGLLHLTRPESDRGGFRTQITVEEIRRLNHFFRTTSADGWRVAIVDPAEDMNRSAANALLKVLEEPPARSVFLIVNHAPGRLLPTIRSRCRVLRFEPLTPSEIAGALENGEAVFAPADAARAASLAEGSLRTAYLLLQSGGLEISAEVARLVGMTAPDWAGVQRLADSLALKGRETAFDLMVADLFRQLAREADDRLAAGDLEGAASLAAYWQSEQARWREAAAFNLDRKQTLITYFHGLVEARRGRARAA